jgi:hypothetical protein
MLVHMANKHHIPAHGLSRNSNVFYTIGQATLAAIPLSLHLAPDNNVSRGFGENAGKLA